MRTSKQSLARGFTRYDKAHLQKAMQPLSDKRTFLRLKSVWLFACGMKVTEIAKVADSSRQIIYKWINSYLALRHSDALKDAYKTGRPLSAVAITDKRILAELKRNPLQLGYATNVWTVAILAQHLSQRYRCPIHPRTLRRRMKAVGLRFKRPRYVYSEKDPHRAQKKGLLSES